MYTDKQHYVVVHGDDIANVSPHHRIADGRRLQSSRPSRAIDSARTAPLCKYSKVAAHDSLECVKLLCEHYKISSAALRPPTEYQAFLLLFTRLVQLVTSFFLR
jgi:hypothetical protein